MLQMAKLDLNGDDEKVNIETIFWSAMDILSDDDKKLPQASSYSVSVCFYVLLSQYAGFRILAFIDAIPYISLQVQCRDSCPLLSAIYF